MWTCNTMLFNNCFYAVFHQLSSSSHWIYAYTEILYKYNVNRCKLHGRVLVYTTQTYNVYQTWFGPIHLL